MSNSSQGVNSLFQTQITSNPLKNIKFYFSVLYLCMSLLFFLTSKERLKRKVCERQRSSTVFLSYDVTGDSLKAVIYNSKVDSLFIYLHHSDLLPRFLTHTTSVSLCSRPLWDLLPSPPFFFFTTRFSSLHFNLERLCSL